jgi:hypothetical protein
MKRIGLLILFWGLARFGLAEDGPVRGDFFGMNTAMPPGTSYQDARQLADHMRASSIRLARINCVSHDWIMGGSSPHPTPNWSASDPAVRALCEDSIEPLIGTAAWSCQEDWARHAPRRTGGDASSPWFAHGFRPVFVDDTVNRDNYLAEWVMEVLERYGPDGSFWSQNDSLPKFPLHYFEFYGEPNLDIPTPYFGYADEQETLYRDTAYRRIESTLVCVARTASETIEARRKFRDTLVVQFCKVIHEVVQHYFPSGEVEVVGPQVGGIEALWRPTNSKGKDFLRRFYDYGGGPCCDIVSASLYQEDPNTESQQCDRFDPAFLKANLDSLRATMKANGDGDKEFWIVEYGFRREPPGSAAEAVAPAMLSVLGAGEDPENVANRMLWFCFSTRYYKAADSAYALSNADFKHYPAGYAYDQFMHEIAGKRVNGRYLQGDVRDATVRVYELEDTATGEKTWVGWRTYAPGATAIAVRIPTRTDRSDIAPMARSAVVDRLNRTMAARSDGWLALALDTIPVYVHETGPVMRPDLTVDSLWTEESPDNTVTLHARVKNVGNKQFVSSGKKGSLLRFAIDGEPVDPSNEPAKLALGGIALVDSAPVSPNRGVEHLVSAEANPDKEMMELNFDNNADYCPLSAR